MAKAVAARISSALRLGRFDMTDGFGGLMEEYFGARKVDAEGGLLELMIFAEFRVHRKSGRDHKLSKTKKKGTGAWCRRSM